MTTNQTIDGVSRRMLTALLCHVSELENRALVDELRALLDAAPHGWKPCSPELLESGVDCATAPRWSAKEWDGHSHWHPAPAAQPQGEPVAWTYCPECGCEEIHHQQGRHKQCAECHQEWFSDLDYSDVVRGHLKKLKAERPAPVSVVLPERLQQVLKFLDGAENLDGHWFGEPHPSGRKYWWRAELRKAIDETNLFAKQQ